MSVRPPPGADRFLVAPACLAGAVAVFAYLAPGFLSWGNLANVGAQMWVLALLAVGQMFAIVTRGFDISVGTIAALSSTVAALAVNAWGPSGLLAGPLAGLLCGTLNGRLIGSFDVPPIVATLATFIGLRGIAVLLTGNGQVVPLRDAGPMTGFVYNAVLGLPPADWVALLLVLVAAWVLRHAVLGRRLLMLGSNSEAVRLVGGNPARLHRRAYQLCGLFAGCAGLLLMLRAGAALPTEGAGMELQSIAAAVIGGTALAGGVGSVAAVLAGAAFIQVLLTGLNLQGVSPFIAQIAVGVVIIAAGLLEYAIQLASGLAPRQMPALQQERSP